MSAGHDHSGGEIKHEKPLWWAFALTATFMLVEIIGGVLSNSLALLADAAHMATDVLALAISLIAVRLSRRPPDARRTYGYARMEALGALVNGALLFIVAGYILFEAWRRFGTPQPVASNTMLLIAMVGLVINLIAMRLLKAGSGENLNMKGAYLEVWSDMLGSVGVIIAAVVIMLTGWTFIDAIIAVLIGLWVLPRTWTLLREAGNVLMQGTPAGIQLDAVRAELQSLPGVSEVHDLHIWALGSREPILSAHIVLNDSARSPDAVRSALSDRLEARFHIHHATLQIENESCRNGRHAPHVHA